MSPTRRQAVVDLTVAKVYTTDGEEISIPRALADYPASNLAEIILAWLKKHAWIVGHIELTLYRG